jgi:hypothetical protein
MSSDYLKDSYESALRENHELRRENLALQAKVKEYELVCGALVEYMQPIHSTSGGLELKGFGYLRATHPLAVIFKRLVKASSE